MIMERCMKYLEYPSNNKHFKATMIFPSSSTSFSRKNYTAQNILFSFLEAVSMCILFSSHNLHIPF